MKFTIPTQEFNYLINKCLNIIAAKTTLPILSNILLEASNGVLSLTASDLTVGVRAFAEVAIEEEGATTLPARKLAGLIRELTAANVQLTTSSSDVTEIRADSSRFKINGMSKEHFPRLPDVADATLFELPQKDLRYALSHTAFAVSRDETRFVFTGVCLKIVDGTATCVATDGKRLARTILPIALDPAFKGSFVIPIKAVDEALKSLKEEGEATVYLLKDKLAIQTEDTFLVTKLIEGEYPDLSEVIPGKVEKFLCLHRDEVTTLLKQTALFTTDDFQVVRFSFLDGVMRLAAQNTEVGEGHVSMPVNYHGEKMDIAFNPMYLLDFLRHSRGETVSLGLIDPFSPGILTDSSTQEYAPTTATPLYVLMPLRLQE